MRATMAMEKRRRASIKELQEAQSDEVKFNKLIKEHYETADVDQNGYLDEKELRAVAESILAQLGHPALDDKTFALSFKEADADGDGKVDFEEYKAAMLKFLNNLRKETKEQEKRERATPLFKRKLSLTKSDGKESSGDSTEASAVEKRQKHKGCFIM